MLLQHRGSRKEVEADGKRTEEWHYYISSRKLSAEELLHHARMEWAVESMHWLLDVHYGEDYCRIACWNLIFCVRSWKLDFRGCIPRKSSYWHFQKRKSPVGFVP